MLLSSGVNYGTKWFVTFEKWKKRDFVHYEIERFVDLCITLLQGPLAHLRNLTVSTVIDGRVSNSVEAWSLIKTVDRDLIISICSLLRQVCS